MGQEVAVACLEWMRAVFGSLSSVSNPRSDPAQGPLISEALAHSSVISKL